MQFQLTEEQKLSIKKEVIDSHFDFKFEKNKLKAYLGDTLYYNLKKSNAIIGGGMITSLFTNKEINDVDVYFRDYDDLYYFANKQLIENHAHIVSHTKKATQFLTKNKKTNNDLLVQIIHYRKFESVEELFDSYDFTICMGAYDFKTESFILHHNFLKHNAQSILKFNSKTSYPLISAIRLAKYEKRGYTISKSEYFRIIMTCMALKINSYEELKEHLGGMYGESYDRLFEDVDDDSEFDIQLAIDKIANLSLSDEYFEKYVAIDYSMSEIIKDLDKGTVKILNLQGNEYRVLNGKLLELYSIHENYIEVDVNDFFKNSKFYKFVKLDSTNNELSSFYHSSFKYIIGEEVKAVEEYSGYGNKGKLFFNHKNTILDSTFYNKDDKVLIEVDINPKDIITYSDSDITASKCKVLRVVPEQEWLNFNE